MYRVASLWLLQACGPSPVLEPLDSGNPIVDTAEDTSSEATLSHAQDIQPIWDKTCGGCHLDGSDSGDLNLDDGFASLVDIPSVDVPTMPLVSPGEPDDSYLWHKLEGTHRDVGGGGIAMPKNDTLNNGQRDRIFAWIEDGALP
jgi:hypothetical protein